MAVQPGDKLGQYEITAELGRGGMATVFKAHQPSMGRYVAIKVLPEQFLHDPGFISRFTNEARVIAQLEHPRILPVHDFGQAAGVPYIVMRFMPHGSLRDKLRAGPLPLPDVARAVEQIAEALDFAHGRGVIHRDLKPDNVLLDQAGNACLSDFGIAKVMEASMVTSGTMVMGTPPYMAPEQIKGRKPSPQTDVYALGVMAFELLAGRLPFVAEDFLALMYMHANEPVPRLANFRPGLSPALQAVVERAMAKTPEARCQSAGELAQGLAAAVQAGAAAAIPPAAKPHIRSTVVEGSPATPASPPRPLPLGPPVSRPRGGSNWGLRRWLSARWLGGVLALGALALAGLQLFGGKATPALAPTQAVEAAATATIAQSRTPADTPLPTPTLKPTGLWAAFADARGVPMALVPAGPFEMGSDADIALAECQKLFIGGSCQRDWFTNEEPIHTVTLDGFHIDRYEVTNARYAECVDAGACDPPNQSASYSRSSYYGDRQYDDYPVIFVSWDDAKAYCDWRGARLPAEAEWEKAARGTDGRLYPWGDTFDGNRMNFCDRNCAPDWANKDYDDGYADTAPVGSYPDGVSPYEVYDMAGNVWEWVADWYDSDYYANSPSENPTGPSLGENRVLRGGSWDFNGYNARAALRFWAEPGYSNLNIGFRCSRSP